MHGLQINKSTYNIYKYTAFLSIAVIFLLGVAFLQPFSFTENTNAETASLDTSVTLEPAITIWTTDTNNNASSQVNIAADPDESVATGTIRAHVSTNNLIGYTLTIQSNNADAKMTHENESVAKTINPLTGSGTSTSSWKSNSSLNNMWGYSIGSDDSFLGVPGSSGNATTIDETDAPGNDNYTDVTFAAKADLSLPAGTYTDTVIFSAVANALPAPAMQDFTRAQCKALPTWSSPSDDFILRDSRDNNEYFIRKLADGNCWMVQNLRLTRDTLSAAGNTTGILTSSNTNVASDTTLPAVNPSFFTSGGNAPNAINSQKHMDSGNTEFGAYYSWAAATLNSDAYSASSDNIETSICPKSGSGSSYADSWHLPSGTNSGEWYNMITRYADGIRNFIGASNTGNTRYAFHDASITGVTNTYGDYVPNLPFSGVRNGSNTYGQGSSRGDFWSSTAFNASQAYKVNINSAGFVGAASSEGNYVVDAKTMGLSVRCVLSSE